MKTILIPILVLATAPLAPAGPSPYAGEQGREIKALSADEIDGYLGGRGMGLARPAELNGYPGPRHVLDLAEELQLTPAQAGALTGVFERMKSAAIPLGGKLVAKESELDRLFAGQRADEPAVRGLTREIGQLQGELRAVHLEAHLATVKILTEEQVRRYNHLRGYDSGAISSSNHHGHQPGTP